MESQINEFWLSGQEQGGEQAPKEDVDSPEEEGQS